MKAINHYRTQLLLVAFTVFTDFLDFGIAVPLYGSLFLGEGSRFFPSYFSDPVKYFLFGLLISSYSIAQFFMAPLLGQLSDKYGRRRVLVSSLFGTVWARSIFVIAIYTQNIFLAFFARLLDGATGGNTSVAIASVNDISEEKKRARNISYIYVAMAAGGLIGPVIAGFVHAVPIFEKSLAPFIFSLLIALSNLILVGAFLREPLKKLAIDLVVKPLHAVKDMLKVFYDHDFSDLFKSLTLFLVAYNIVSQLFPIYMVKTFDLNPSEVSIIFFLITVAIIFTQAVVFYYIHKKISASEIVKRSLPIAILFVLTLLFYRIPFIGPNTYILVILVIIFASMYALSMPSFSVIFTEEAGKKKAGYSLGIVQSAQAFSSAVGPIVGGGLIAIFYDLPILVCAILIFVSLKLYTNWEKK